MTTNSDRPLIGNPNLPEVSHGRGAWLVDTAGEHWLDGSSGAMAASLGHGLPELATALAEQANRVAFAHRTQWRNAPAEQLATVLIDRAPDPLRRVMLCSSGSEANEAACKLAVRWQQAAGRSHRQVIVSRELSYHGSTLGSQSATGHPGRRRPDDTWLCDWPRFPAPSCRSCRHDCHHATCADASLDELDALLDRRDDVAAVICEPIGGAASGVLVPPAGYYERLRDICTRHGVLWIADEVVTGTGRTGHFYGTEHWDAAPDLLTLGKGLSGGYAPIAAVLAAAEVADPLTQNGALPLIGHTWSAVPLTAAAALAATRFIDDQHLLSNAEHQGRQIRERLRTKLDGIGLVRGLGLLIGLEIVGEHGEPLPASTTQEIVAAARRHRLLVYPAAGCADGDSGAAVIVAPPLTIDDATINELIDCSLAAIDEVGRVRSAV